jgi:peptidoglycan/xylan/chitin deacetylase (PgdA/CDA1 family)
MHRRLLRGLLRVERLRWRLRSRVSRSRVVLCYHGLRRPDEPDSWLRVEAGAFGRQLRTLAGCGSFVHPDAFDSPENLRGPGPHFLLTFDDGYEDQAELGLPHLTELGIPAVFFVSTHHMLTGEPFWFDQVVCGVRSTGLERIDLGSVGLRTYSFRGRRPAARWEGLQRLLVDIKLAEGRRAGVLAPLLTRLTELAGASAAPPPRPLAPARLAGMAKSGNCTVGSHGHAHEILTALDDAGLCRSLERSKKELEGLTGREVTRIAYPNGDADDRVVTAAVAAGYRRGFTVRPGAVSTDADPMRLPRISIGGYDSPALVAAKVYEAALRGPA